MGNYNITLKQITMGQQQSYNVQNQVTGILILDSMGVPVEYSLDQAEQAVINFTTQTGQNHIYVGPHPKPHA